ncbi:MAG: septum formation initiator family protein [Candidatus Cloacimonetes bacterium]|jgi:cell division protein FtsB|nr:septum formation initiator family protein [Candidatus Cloacimonadota bacterium]HPM01352.1 septum formation initiator family protein [Candidatus Cloacimonadota bacterium]
MRAIHTLSNHSKAFKKVFNLFMKLVIVYLFIDMLVLNDFSLIKWIAARHDLSNIKNEVSLLHKENLALQKENEKLENDPQAIEKIAREKYGMQKPDEKVYRFVTED